MILEKRIPISYWFNLIKWELITVSIFSTSIYFLSEKYFEFTIPIGIPGFLGTSIALLLSFKLSQSYDRWWEARKIWGSIVNDSRTLVLQLLKFTNIKSIKLINKIGLRQIGWCYALTYTLRNQKRQSHINQFITPEEIDCMNQLTHTPLWMLRCHNNDIQALYNKKQITDLQHIQLDNTIVRLCDSMGKLERIKKTVFPKTYRMTLRFFIYMFLVILSIAIKDINSWIEVPLIAIISIPFFLLERISKNIQNPFENKPTDTPMLAISHAIEINIKQLLRDDNIPEDIELKTFYMN